MSDLLATKLYFPPARENRVRRPRLVGKLQAGLRGRLTVVAAPAGYGKTTLLGEWRAEAGREPPAAWLSLDVGDNDPARFLLYLVAAIETVRAELVPAVRALLEASPPAPTEAVLTTLVNATSALQEELVLVLDDYHVISALEVHQAVAFLLDYLPPQVHLVILTRANPPLPLARLRARDQLVEIRAADLRFTRDEALLFLNEVMGLALAAEEVAALEARTEGWAAGLQLAALSMRERDDLGGFIASFTGSHQYIVDFLAQEVLDRQPEQVREFLLRTSILQRLSGPLCDALTGRADGQATLESLAAANLFLVPLDGERRWYRYHHLFAEVLQSHLRRAQSGRVADLHRRAAAWFQEHGMVVPAIDHLISTRDFDRVAQALRETFPAWMRFGNRSVVDGWFAAFPPQELESNPWLCVVNAWLRWAVGQAEETIHWLDCADAGLARLVEAGQLPENDLEYDALPAEILAFRGLICSERGDLAGALELSNRALACVPEAARTVQGIAQMNLYLAHRDLGEIERAVAACRRAYDLARAGGEPGTVASSLTSLGIVTLLQGKYREAQAVYRDGLRWVASQDPPPRSGHLALVHVHLARIAYGMDDLAEAERQLALVDEILAQSAQLWVSIYGRIQRAYVRLARGDRAGALEMYEQAEGLLPAVRGAYYEDELRAYLMGLGADLGRLEESGRWIERALSRPDDHLGYYQFEARLQGGRVLAALGRWTDLIDLLDPIAAEAEARGCVHWLIQALVLMAVAWGQLGDRRRALEQLQAALTLAEPEKLVRVFVERGEPMQALLAEASRDMGEGAPRDHIRHLLGALGEAAERERPARQPLVAPLTRREMEVLELVAAGRSNQEIANELVIAIGTVKRHTVNIFTKLDVRNRTEAVARGRELGIL